MRNKMFGVNRVVGGTTLKDGLVSVWELNETLGPTAFDSHGSNDGAIIGATLNQTGLTNLTPCYSFNGTSDWVNIPSVTIGTSYSFNIWVKTSYTGVNFQYLYGDRNDSSFRSWTYFGISTAGLINFTNRTSTGIVVNPIGTTDVRDNSWHMITGTYEEGGDAILYVDTVEEARVASVTLGFTSIAMGIGFFPQTTSTTRYYNDLADQAGVWDRHLIPSEIVTLNNSMNGLAYANW